MDINQTNDFSIGETGIVDSINHNSQTIILENQYENPVIFTQPLSYNSQSPAIVRIEEVQSDRFTAFVQEPSDRDGWHGSESFSYLVLEKGTWQLEDNTVLEVGTLNSDLLAPNGWEEVNFANDFSEDPLIFSNLQTNNDPDFAHTRQKNASIDGFQIAIEKEEKLNSTDHGEESLGWLAVSAGSGSGTQNNYQAGQSNRVNHDWQTINLESFAESPTFLASITTYNGADPSTLRYNQLSNNDIQIKIEEDTSQDSEIKHVSEAVNFLAIDENASLYGMLLGGNVEPVNAQPINAQPVSVEPGGESKIGHYEDGPSADAEELDQDWDIVYDGLNQSEPLRIDGMQNVLIKNSTFKNIEGKDAITIRDSDNVHIENVTIDNLSGKNSLSGIRIDDSANVTIEDSTITKIFSPQQSAGIKITGGKSANITIDDNHIYDTYGNGISSGGNSSASAGQTVHDTPVPGLKITNNLIHDTGKTPTPRGNSPTHGMYLKAQDAYVANNTVYNSFDGVGITLRSTAKVINNKIWDTKLSAVSFLQMKPAGSSQESIFENNELFYTENKPEGPTNIPLLHLNWKEGSAYPLRYDTFTIRDNKLSVCDEYLGTNPLIRLYPFQNLTLTDNELIDHRAREQFFSYMATPSVRYENQNTNSFNEAKCPEPTVHNH